jgi:hypothetical protein
MRTQKAVNYAPPVSSGGGVASWFSREEPPHDRTDVAVSAINEKEKHMVRKHQPIDPCSTKVTRIGLEKMRMNNERTR